MGCGASSAVQATDPKKRSTTRLYRQTDVASDVWSRRCFDNGDGESDVALSFRIPNHRSAPRGNCSDADDADAAYRHHADTSLHPPITTTNHALASKNVANATAHHQQQHPNSADSMLLPPAAVTAVPPPHHEFPTFIELPGALESEDDDDDDDVESRDGMYGPSVARPKTTLLDLQRSLLRNSALTDALINSSSRTNNDPSSVPNLSLAQLSVLEGSIRQSLHPHQTSFSDSLGSMLTDTAPKSVPTEQTSSLPGTHPHKGRPREGGSMPQLALPSPQTKSIARPPSSSITQSPTPPLPRPGTAVATVTRTPPPPPRPLFHLELTSSPTPAVMTMPIIETRCDGGDESPRSMHEDEQAVPAKLPTCI